jgi:ABC-type transporter Mla subunit MlaD
MTPTPTPTLIRALRILARDIHSDDGVANCVIDEAALRLEELDDHLTATKRDLEQANSAVRRATEHIRHLSIPQ